MSGKRYTEEQIIYTVKQADAGTAVKEIGVSPSSFYYRSRARAYEALKMRLKELALSRIRFGYLRLTVLLRREGWVVGKKLVYRLYRELDLAMRTKKRRRLASRSRMALPSAQTPNERWSMDFVSVRLENGRRFRVLTLVDQYTRECLALEPAFSMSGVKVAACLDAVVADRGLPKSIRVDNGTEFQSRAMDAWAYRNGVQLDFIPPGKPVESGLIESFYGRLRDECLNIHLFWTIGDAKAKLVAWQVDYNQHRPHGSLGYLTPNEYARKAGKQQQIGLLETELLKV